MLNNKVAQVGKRRLAALQILLVCVLTVAFYLFDGIQAAYSACLGGLICCLASQFFARKLFKHAGAQAARQIVRSLYVGEAGKLALTAVMFALVFQFIPISAPAFFISYIAIQLLYWVTPWLFVYREANEFSRNQ